MLKKGKPIKKVTSYKMASRARAERRGEVATVVGDTTEVCVKNPLCFRFQVEFDPKTIELTGIDLFDRNDEIWLSLSPPFDEETEQKAKRALRRTATSGFLSSPCHDRDCKCKLGKRWSAWSPWSPVEIFGGFSISPLFEDPRPHYRATGKVKVKSRMKVGTCYRIRLSA
jgi:hypothetical protein